jgi:hypothetical protein
LTLSAQVWFDGKSVQKSPPPDLAQIFQRIRDDLDVIEREFAGQVESRATGDRSIA